MSKFCRISFLCFSLHFSTAAHFCLFCSTYLIGKTYRKEILIRKVMKFNAFRKSFEKTEELSQQDDLAINFKFILVPLIFQEEILRKLISNTIFKSLENNNINTLQIFIQLFTIQNTNNFGCCMACLLAGTAWPSTTRFLVNLWWKKRLYTRFVTLCNMYTRSVNKSATRL